MFAVVTENFDIVLHLMQKVILCRTLELPPSPFSPENGGKFRFLNVVTFNLIRWTLSNI